MCNLLKFVGGAAGAYNILSAPDRQLGQDECTFNRAGFCERNKKHFYKKIH